MQVGSWQQFLAIPSLSFLYSLDNWWSSSLVARDNAQLIALYGLWHVASDQVKAAVINLVPDFFSENFDSPSWCPDCWSPLMLQIALFGLTLLESELKVRDSLQNTWLWFYIHKLQTVLSRNLMRHVAIYANWSRAAKVQQLHILPYHLCYFCMLLGPFACFIIVT